MKPFRNVGNLSALHLPGIAQGLKTTTAGCKMSAEETKRLKRFFVTMKPLAEEAKGQMQEDVAEARVREADLRVDRNWVVLRDILDAYARLEDAASIGIEAARIGRKYFSDMAFIRFDTAAQATHGSTLLACIEEEPMSKELTAVVRPVLDVQKKDHAEYEGVVQQSLTYIERISALNPLRRDAIEALQSFVVIAEAMATSPEEIAQLNAILAPVDAILAKAKATPAKDDEPTEEEKGPQGPQD